MDSTTTWAEHHGAAAVDALIKQYPQADAVALREVASRWHATENLPGFLAACCQPLDSGKAYGPPSRHQSRHTTPQNHP